MELLIIFCILNMHSPTTFSILLCSVAMAISEARRVSMALVRRPIITSPNHKPHHNSAPVHLNWREWINDCVHEGWHWTLSRCASLLTTGFGPVIIRIISYAVWRWWLTEANYYFYSNNSNFQLGSPSRISWFLQLIYPNWHEMCEMFLCACILHCCWERHYSGWWIVFASVIGFCSVIITWSIRTDHWACTLIMTSTSQQPLLIVN